MRQGSPGDLRGIGQQHLQARNAQIGNAEMAPARARWRGGRGVRSRPTRQYMTPFCCGVSPAHPWRVSGRSKRDLAAPASCRTRCSAQARVRLRPISAHGRIWPTALCSGRAVPVLWPMKPTVPLRGRLRGGGDLSVCYNNRTWKNKYPAPGGSSCWLNGPSSSPSNPT